MATSGLPALAFRWVDTLRQGAIDDLWSMAEPQFRLGLALMWIWHTASNSIRNSTLAKTVDSPENSAMGGGWW